MNHAADQRNVEYLLIVLEDDLPAIDIEIGRKTVILTDAQIAEISDVDQPYDRAAPGRNPIVSNAVLEGVAPERDDSAVLDLHRVAISKMERLAPHSGYGRVRGDDGRKLGAVVVCRPNGAVDTAAGAIADEDDLIARNRRENNLRVDLEGLARAGDRRVVINDLCERRCRSRRTAHRRAQRQTQKYGDADKHCGPPLVATA